MGLVVFYSLPVYVEHVDIVLGLVDPGIGGSISMAKVMAHKISALATALLRMAWLLRQHGIGGDTNRADERWATSRTKIFQEAANLRPSLELASSPRLVA